MSGNNLPSGSNIQPYILGQGSIAPLQSRGIQLPSPFNLASGQSGPRGPRQPVGQRPFINLSRKAPAGFLPPAPVQKNIPPPPAPVQRGRSFSEVGDTRNTFVSQGSTGNMMRRLNSPYPLTKNSGELRLKLRLLKRQFLAMNTFDWTYLINKFQSPQRNFNRTFDTELEPHIITTQLDAETNDMITRINKDTTDSQLRSILSTLFEDDFREIDSVKEKFKQGLLKKILGESGYPEELAVPIKFTLIPSSDREKQRAQLINDIILEDTIITAGANDTYETLKDYADNNPKYADKFKNQYGMNFSNLPAPQRGSWFTDWRSKMISAIDEKAVNRLVTELYGPEYLAKNIDRRAKTRKES